MRCTAAECYAANPASGIVEPNGRNIISGKRKLNEYCIVDKWMDKWTNG